MATKALKTCAAPNCNRPTAWRYCTRHHGLEQQQKREQEQRRETSCRRMYGYKWQRARQAYLRKHPLCVHCQAEGRTTPAMVVDHITPHKGSYQLFWDQSNWQGLCVPHHNRKTAREDGGFGNKQS